MPDNLTYLKFVVSNEKDLEEVNSAVKFYRDNGFKGSVYLMPVGGTVSTYTLNAKEVALLAIKNNYRYSPRLQVDLFKNNWGC